MKIVIKIPSTNEIKTLTQEQFNSYMAQTNGEAANWIVEESE
jgi:hypothetical protein